MKKKSKKKFPDLSGDGKVTKKDILMGRGVISRNEAFNFEVLNRVQNNEFWQGVSDNSTLYESELKILDDFIESYKSISEAIITSDYPVLNESEVLLESETVQERISQISLEELGDIFNDQLEFEGHYDSLEDIEIDQYLGECLTNWSEGHGFRTDEAREAGVESVLNEEQLNEFLSKLFGGGKKFNRGEFRRKMAKKRRIQQNIDRGTARYASKEGQVRHRKKIAQRYKDAGGKVVRGGQQASDGGGKPAAKPSPAPAAGGSSQTAKKTVSADEKKRRMDKLKAAKLKRQTDLKAGRGYQASERGTAKVRTGRATGDAAALARDKKGVNQRAGDKAALKGGVKAKNKGAFAGKLSPSEKRKARATRGKIGEARLGLAERVLNELKKSKK